MDAVSAVIDNFGIPRKYIKSTSRKDRVVTVVHRSWLKSLLRTHNLTDFVYHESLSADEVEVWLHQGEDLGPQWQRLFIRVLAKRPHKVIPLPRARAGVIQTESQLSYAQLLHYVSQTNHKNLWKEAFKKYLSTYRQGGAISSDCKNAPHITPVSCDSVMRDIICRTFSCPIIRLGSDSMDFVAPDGKSKVYEVHCNILLTLCAVETPNCFLLIQQPFIGHSLQDCVTFSPAMLGTSHSKPLFIIYQLLQAMRSMHDRGLVLGDIMLSDILVTENLWVQVMPQLEDNIHNVPETESSHSKSQYFTFSKRNQTVEVCISCGCELRQSNRSNHTQGSELSSHLQDCEHCKKATNTQYNPSLEDIVATTLKDIDVSCEGASDSQVKQKIEVKDVSERNKLQYLCELWLYGQLSNFDYLMMLNRLAGRRYGDPTSHYVMPWVTDFSSRSGGTWRDLSRSKFRLNKGDRQLDLTYDTATGMAQVPHHVSDVLSEITYYVYMARRTPRSVLCKYVRTKWVPAEYPSSIQRLQEWTPDECIPEFFTNPTVFESIHDDLPHLEVPAWASSTQEFIEKHREALESVHVSERLHHWIDLTFGYKLSGSAAIKSKNVCLQLVDSHTTLTNTGVVQLFTHPHPQRIVPSPFWGKTPPKLYPPPRDRKKFCERMSEDEGHSSGFEEEDISGALQNPSRSSPLALSRLLSRSRGSLLAPFPSPSSSDDGSARDRPSEQQKSSSGLSGANGTSAIVLPKDYNPAAALQSVESIHSFIGKTFHGSTLPRQQSSPETTSSAGYKQVVATRRIREMQILGCLVVELFLASKLRALGSHNVLSFEQRLQNCHSVLARSGDSLPRCMRHAVSLLLQVDFYPSFVWEDDIAVDGEIQEDLISPQLQEKTTYPFRYPTVTSQGLPPPSAHQLLQPLLSSAVFPFPRHFLRLYALLQKYHDFSTIIRELKFLNYIDVNGTCPMDDDTTAKIALFGNKIGELKVETTSDELASLLPQMLSSSPESLHLILPYIRELLEDPTTSVVAAWHLFDPVAKVLGPQQTAATLLESIVKLYDYGIDDDGTTASEAGNKHVKLYHRSFLLRLVVRLGLRTFLENFVTPLVEAVGGYRDFSQADSGFNHHRSEIRNKTSNLKTCDLDEPIQGGTLSPLDEDSSGDSEHTKPSNGEDDEPKKLDDEEEVDMEVEPEVFVFETEDCSKASPPGEGEAPLYHLMDHLDLNLPQTLGDGDDNTSLDLQVEQQLEGDQFPLNAMDDEAAEAFVEEGEEPLQHEPIASVGGDKIMEEDLVLNDDCHVRCKKEEKARKPIAQYKVSDMSVDSVVWLSHRLGPVLTSRHLSRNLLRMLTLCYLGKENLSPLPPSDGCSPSPDINHILSIANGRVVGDQNAIKVLDCLASIAGLYGEQLIVLQYLPHMGELIALCKRKLTANLEGGLVGCLALLKHIIPYLCDSMLMDQLQDVILKSILNPAVRLVSTTRFLFPSGAVARTAVATKFVDAVYVMALRIGCEMTRKNLAVPSLQRFFLTFDKAHGRKRNEDVGHLNRSIESRKGSPLRSLEESSYLEIRRDGTTTEWTVKGPPLQISHVRLRDSDSADSYSPPPLVGSDCEQAHDQARRMALAELKSVFSPELAHKSYLPFLQFLGDIVMEQSLKNEDFIRDLCFEYEQERTQSQCMGGPVDFLYLSDYLSPGSHLDPDKGGSGGFGSNVAIIGNRIDLQREDIPSVVQPVVSGSPNLAAGDVMALISRKMENTKRHLRGNWLAYWEHEIGRAEKDTRFNFKQIKLQTFSGHSNSVRTVQALDNENSFLSGSRDKTVKLWSLRSEGDGSTVSHCQWTYTGHRKSVMAISFLESLRLAASCDSVVHLWDPFMGCVVGQLDATRNPPVNVLRAMPPPSTCLLASTTDATLRLIDGRTCSFINELKVSLNPAGLIRCIAVGPQGTWVAVGQSSGALTILDIRTGTVLASWKGHEGEVLQLVAANGNTLVSSSLDQTVSAWSTLDGKLSFHMKGPTEPAHCLSSYGSELISGTTASRIGVHTAVDAQASFSSTRLRSDTFKGVLTAMAVLPLNRLLLLGSDSGNISLLC